MPTITNDGIYYVDLGFDPLFSAPGSFISVYPEQLSFDYEIRQVGNISFQISFSARDQDGNIVVKEHDFVGPYNTGVQHNANNNPIKGYWRLRYGDVAIASGIIVSTNCELGVDYMSVAGKTWEHILELWQYPWDPNNIALTRYAEYFNGNESVASGGPTPAGLLYEAYQRDVILIIGDLLTQTMNIVPHREILDLSGLTGLAGITTDYQLVVNDTSNMFTLISDLATLGDGFDWWIDTVKKFRWASPYRFGSYVNPNIIWVFNGATDDQTPDSLQFTNNGPAETHVVGTGAGLAVASTLAVAYNRDINQQYYGRTDQNYNWGEVLSLSELQILTRKRFSIDLNPQHDIPLSVDPLRIANFWGTFRIGMAVTVDYDLIAHQIQDDFQLQKISLTGNDNNMRADFTLKQIYPLASADSSVTEGA